MLEVWREKGKKCIEATAENHPEKLVSIVAGLLPKELNVKTNPLEDMSEEELETCLQWVRHYIDSQSGSSPPDTKH